MIYHMVRKKSYEFSLNPIVSELVSDRMHDGHVEHISTKYLAHVSAYTCLT